MQAVLRFQVLVGGALSSLVCCIGDGRSRVGNALNSIFGAVCRGGTPPPPPLVVRSTETVSGRWRQRGEGAKTWRPDLNPDRFLYLYFVFCVCFVLFAEWW